MLRICDWCKKEFDDTDEVMIRHTYDKCHCYSCHTKATHIATCNYNSSLPSEKVYVRETEDGYFKWYDTMGESTDDFDSVEDALESFMDYMAEESPDTYIRVAYRREN